MDRGTYDNLLIQNILLSNLSISTALVSAVGLSSEISAYLVCKLVYLNSAQVAISLRYEEVKPQFQVFKSHLRGPTPVFTGIGQIFL